jgi:hypothetical protein
MHAVARDVSKYLTYRTGAVLDSSTKLDNKDALDETETFGKKKAF